MGIFSSSKPAGKPDPFQRNTPRARNTISRREAAALERRAGKNHWRGNESGRYDRQISRWWAN